MISARLYKVVIIGWIFLIILSNPLSAKSLGQRLSNETINYYFDLVLSGNYESACGLWEPSSFARANRLGIEYENIGVKIDCTSPVIYDFEKMRKYITQGVHSVAIIDSQIFRWKFETEKGGKKKDNISHYYFTAKTDNYFWLITPRDYYARDWNFYQSRYFRYYISPVRDAYYNDIAAESLDRYVEKIAKKLSIPDERLKLLEEMKIDYYLCKSPYEVELLSGKKERGVYDPASDAVITSLMPHYYTVAMQLINFKLQTLPLCTVPILQKSAAAYLGGRWQRSPEVVCDFGAYILKYGILEADSLFDNHDNESGEGGDLTSPVGACLAEYLWAKLSMERFFELYRSLSGNYRYITELPIDTIKSRIAGYLDQDWDTFNADFLLYATRDKSNEGSIRPGDIFTDRELINEDGLVISVSKEWLNVQYTAGKDNEPSVSILFDRIPELDDKISMLYKEQYPTERINKFFRYGIKLDKNEIGLYDYASNLIVAKYIDNFSADTDYFDETDNKISAYINIELLNDVLPGDGEYQIVK